MGDASPAASLPSRKESIGLTATANTELHASTEAGRKAACKAAPAQAEGEVKVRQNADAEQAVVPQVRRRDGARAEAARRRAAVRHSVDVGIALSSRRRAELRRSNVIVEETISATDRGLRSTGIDLRALEQ